ncbi:electron transfer flavoprotein subunit alpha/FixB family protein [Ancylomarina euxinus]|uniref:Electron transfer flavoprotein subunit alpha/FixB family protein n=1 Tax=Ancylomarina euxinus TaxID=2283627 RepID=A0A425XX94_9BACT|nr:electron transfer flavoprotein subunit alpha/FixB family protein [Ancylomarina euxinus]MCZ4696158.1 electron transfer flavoprotein subunit alpha/FixB family protein [Ancylomarina euxinus]MUP16567.1 electron transfer flavoprotein subunit alpha/FixB family protein [Ancylomarina euxinus]RRG19272.1 electron transfer flavoprotein subunit alpha/FixB family protein [Ancylomarina euxinus]
MSVIAFAKNWEGKFKKSTYELVSYAKELAFRLNTQTLVLSIGEVEESELEKLVQYGADKIISVDDSRLNILSSRIYAEVISQVVNKEDASYVILSDNNSGKAISPRLSVKLKAGLAAGVLDVPKSLDPFVIKKQVFTGKAFAYVQIDSEKKILTLSKNSFGIVENPTSLNLVKFTPELSDDLFKIKVKSVESSDNKIILADADIVVSAGRGMKSADNWQPVEDLASVMGAATACSRPVSDDGWRGHEEHVGQTGKVIAPNLYFAIGISGAIQHVAGVSRSKCIVAINTDPEAPIFSVADYGVVGDAMIVLPELTEIIRNGE